MVYFWLIAYKEIKDVHIKNNNDSLAFTRRIQYRSGVCFQKASLAN